MCLGQQFDQISRYKVNLQLATKDGKQLIAIRSFANHGDKYLLMVDPQSFATSVALAKDYRLAAVNIGNVEAIFRNTAYIKAIEIAKENDLQLQNAGIAHAIPKEKGITLTIDLCPSHKPLDRVIFSSLFGEFAKIEQPVPLAISVSGKWMLKHEEDLNWLKSLIAEKKLAITWINHSYSHEVNALPLAENFLLSSNTNLDFEVLENEKLMLKNGLIPSVFFRFPGLVSSKRIVEEITNYGLIPVGSDAWLAKGQQPKNGSIVLIHGNGNEEVGIKDFIQLLKQKKIDVIGKQWLLFDLSKGLEQELNK